MTKKNKVAELGDQVVDMVSGYKGIVVSCTTYLQGCARLSVQAKVGRNGELPEWKTFDIGMLKVLKKKAVKQGQTITGGPDKYMPKSKPTATR